MTPSKAKFIQTRVGSMSIGYEYSAEEPWGKVHKNFEEIEFINEKGNEWING